MNKNLLSSLVICTAAALSAPLANADARYNAGDKLGFYVGGSYGFAKSRGGEFDDDNNILGATFGFKFNPYFGVEGIYTKFGEFGNDFASAEVGGYGVAVLGSVPVTDVLSVYAKAGQFFSQVDVEVAGFNDTFDDEQIFYGLGVDLAVSDPLSVIAEYDRYHVDVDTSGWPGGSRNSDFDIDIFKVGVKFKF